MSRKRDICRHYEPRIHHSRENHDVVDWASVASQQARFDVLVETVELRGRKLLDVGCGLGDLWAHLKARNIETHYTGVDICKKMLAAARRHQRGGRFVFADVFADKSPFPREAFDVAFCSGIFNLDLGNNLQFLTSAVGRLMELSRRHVVFNLLHIRTPVRPKPYAYYDPEKVLETIPKAGWEIRLLADYLPNDFTVVCRRD